MAKTEGMKCYYALQYLKERVGIVISDDTLRRMALDPNCPAIECVRFKNKGNLIYYIDLEKTLKKAA